MHKQPENKGQPGRSAGIAVVAAFIVLRLIADFVPFGGILFVFLLAGCILYLIVRLARRTSQSTGTPPPGQAQQRGQAQQPPAGWNRPAQTRAPQPQPRPGYTRPNPARPAAGGPPSRPAYRPEPRAGSSHSGKDPWDLPKEKDPWEQ